MAVAGTTSNGPKKAKPIGYKLNRPTGLGMNPESYTHTPDSYVKVKKKTGPKTGHSRSYPRGVGLDFRKLAGLTLIGYIDHHGTYVCVILFCFGEPIQIFFISRDGARKFGAER